MSGADLAEGREHDIRDAELLVAEAATAERLAYERWQNAYAAYEVACGDVAAAWARRLELSAHR